MDNKLAVLRKVATALNAVDARWALGASAMLYLRGIVDNFGDIDIVVSGSSIECVAGCMDALGVRLPAKSTDKFSSACFMQYSVDSVDIDIICDFGIVCDGVVHSYELCDSDIDCTVALDGVAVPLHSVGVWRKFYFLMGRDAKVQLIESIVQ